MSARSALGGGEAEHRPVHAARRRLASTLGLGPDQHPAAVAIMATPATETLDRLAADAAAGTLTVPVSRTYVLAEVPGAFGDFAGGTLGKLAVTLACDRPDHNGAGIPQWSWAYHDGAGHPVAERPAHAKQTVDLYRRAGEQAGHPEKLRVGISTHFFAGTEDVFPYYHEYLRPKTPGGRGFLVDRAAFEAGTGRGQAIMVGSPEEITEKILHARDLLGIDRFFGQFDWGGLPRPLVEESLHRYATVIAPAVRQAA